MIAVLGSGPHGRQIAKLHPNRSCLFDDHTGPPIDGASFPYLIGAAWPKVRREIAWKVPHLRPYRRGLVFFPGSQVGDDVKLGDHTHLGWNAVVSHGCRVGSFVNICPGAVLAGEVTVGNDVFIGANATVIHGGLTIGDGAVIGAGAVILEDVPPGAVMVGNPAGKLR